MAWRDLLQTSTQDPFPSRRPRLMHLALACLKPIVRRYFPLTVSGLEHLDPTRPVLLAPNHLSYLDPVFLSCAVPMPMALSTVYLAKDKHFQSSLRRWFAARMRVLLIPRRARLREVLPQLAAVLHSGRSLVIFPEGTRSRDGSLQPFKKTFALLACETGVPVVPAILVGANRAAPVGRKWPRRTPVHVTFLPPVHTAGRNPREVALLVEEAVRTQLVQSGLCHDQALL